MKLLSNPVILFLIVLGMLMFLNKKEKFTRPVFSRPNKCFSCEQHITSMKDAHLAFPSKCFSCEKEPITIPYNEGPTKCFACDI
jgi:hypothetical protein